MPKPQKAELEVIQEYIIQEINKLVGKVWKTQIEKEQIVIFKSLIELHHIKQELKFNFDKIDKSCSMQVKDFVIMYWRDLDNKHKEMLELEADFKIIIQNFLDICPIKAEVLQDFTSKEKMNSLSEAFHYLFENEKIARLFTELSDNKIFIYMDNEKINDLTYTEIIQLAESLKKYQAKYNEIIKAE